ncbi:hypothetical protein C8A05DRAFT_20145 [Staphylotrichum tortipilum]|uniref:EthD domain-containing protein n=1 Tax=Staphylotrichum tortipilum TaxID=2831512 RepID=A0AAN6RNW4_9PEZI|nr:hypothetical protein C8A05DRAFT_20145 [Staphylotrichum longicolle]
MARPGLILVYSRPTSPDFTPADLAAWYDAKHIPDILNTGGIHTVSRYGLASSSDSAHEQPYVQFLTVYRLKGMDWLHAETCGFWKLPLVVNDKHGNQRSIFDLAEFETRFWHIISENASEGMTNGEQPNPRCRSETLA